MPYTEDQLRHAADQALAYIILNAPYRSENMLVSEAESSFWKTKPIKLELYHHRDLDDKKVEVQSKAHYKEWRKHLHSIMKESVSDIITPHRPLANAFIEKLEENGFELNEELRIQLKLMCCFHQHVITMKRGVCSLQALASAFFLLFNADVPFTLAQGANRGFDHSFLILGELPKRLDREFDLYELPESCLIVDPWTGCKFTSSQQAFYWGDLAKKFEWTHRRAQIGMTFPALDSAQREILKLAAIKAGILIPIPVDAEDGYKPSC